MVGMASDFTDYTNIGAFVTDTSIFSTHGSETIKLTKRRPEPKDSTYSRAKNPFVRFGDKKMRNGLPGFYPVIKQ